MTVLVLNSQYLPIQITSMKRAIKLIFRGVAVVEKHTNSVWKSISSEFVLPTVIRLVNFYKIPNRNYKLSKRNILIRDRHTCQYCNNTSSDRTLTIDHIIPKSRGGKTSWDNLVAACLKCNSKKGNKTPEEAGMVLSRRPPKMNQHTHTILLRNRGLLNPEWNDYLFH